MGEPFHRWFLYQQLANMGWPRTRGRIRRRLVVDRIAIEMVVSDIASQDAALAVAFPTRAMQLYSASFDRDWETPADDAFWEFATKLFPEFRQADAPWHECSSLISRLVEAGHSEEEVPWILLVVLEPYIWYAHVSILAYSMVYPDAISAAYNRMFERPLDGELVLRLKALGVDMAVVPRSIDGFAKIMDSTLDEYERQFGVLPQTPSTVVDSFARLKESQGAAVNS